MGHYLIIPGAVSLDVYKNSVFCQCLCITTIISVIISIISRKTKASPHDNYNDIYKKKLYKLLRRPFKYILSRDTWENIGKFSSHTTE